MQEFFERDGVRFQFPGDWQLEVETEGDSWTASLQSPETAFLVVTYVPGVDDPAELIEAAVEGLRAEYPDIEVDDAVGSLGGAPAVSADISFQHLDLTNTCWARAIPVADGSLLVLAQSCDQESDSTAPILKGIVQSIHIEES